LTETEASRWRTGEDGVSFNIHRFSLHDGRGSARSVCFLGLQSALRWCANPESQEAGRAHGSREYRVEPLADELAMDNLL
jgi:pyruvate-formate lyase-activating enzyme